MNFRKKILSTGREIMLGKSSSNNDELVRAASSEDIMLHSEKPGSPFTNVGREPSEKEIKEAALFTARYSQDFRDNKKDVVVDIFLRKDMKKDSDMKEGTWRVLKKESLTVKKEDIIKILDS